MEITEYVNLAKKNSNLSSNNQLAKVIGVSSTAVSAFFTKKTIPSDETIVKIAGLARVRPEMALIDLAIWRNEKNASVLKILKKMAENFTY